MKRPTLQREHGNITHRVVFVDPGLASEMLGNMYAGQRPLSKPHVDKIAQDMRGGRWQLPPDPIVRTVDGDYINGQHRLHAVVKSGVCVPMIVTEGWPVDTYKIMDSGLRRKLAHRTPLEWMGQSNTAVGMARMAATVPSVRPSKISEQTLVAVGFLYGDVFSLVTQVLRQKKKISSAVGAALARALIAGVPEATVMRFAEVYAAPHTSDGPSESAAVLLHQRLSGNPWSGEDQRVACYQIATRALQLFAMQATAKMLKNHDQDIFPRPSDMLSCIDAVGGELDV